MKNFHLLKRYLFFLALIGTIIRFSFFNDNEKKLSRLAPEKISKSQSISSTKSKTESDKVIKRDAALEKAEKKKTSSNRQYQELNSNNLFLIQLTRELRMINESCESIAEDIFNDNNYIDPQFELYRNKGEITGKIRRVFREMLIQPKATQAFNLLASEVENNPNVGASPKSWDAALKSLNVCRENEVFYFFETMFESFRLQHLSQQEIIEINKILLNELKSLMQQQQTMSNLLFVMNLVMKSAKSFSTDSYLIGESKRIFERLVDFWRINAHYYEQNSNNGKKNRKPMEIDFYREYIEQTTYYSDEIRKMMMDLTQSY